MKKRNPLFLFLFIGIFLINACSSDDDFTENDDNSENPEIENTYENGFFVLNEGQFPNEGTVTFVSEDFEQVEQKIFQNVNDGMELGNTPQSMFFHENKVFIITNASNFIRVADRYTFEDLGVISGDLENPRYGATANGKAYITNGYAEHITVVDLQSLSVEKTIPMENIGEFIYLGKNGMLYIQQAAFGSGNQIAVLDPNTDEVIETLETAENLNSIALDEEYLYALSAEKLEKFSLANFTQEEEIPLTYETSAANLTLDEDYLYFTSGKKAYRLNTADFSAPETALFEVESDSYGTYYGFEVQDSTIYIADGGDFVSDSYIEIRNVEGEILKTITVGVGPNGFYFNE